MNKLLVKLQNVIDEINSGKPNLYSKADRLISKIEKKMEELNNKINSENVLANAEALAKSTILEQLMHNNSLLDDETITIDSSVNIYLESKSLEKQYMAKTNVLQII